MCVVWCLGKKAKGERDLGKFLGWEGAVKKETWVWFLGWGDPLEKEMATHSSIPTLEISWTEEPGGLQSMGLQMARYDSTTKNKSTWDDGYTPKIYTVMCVSDFLIQLIKELKTQDLAVYGHMCVFSHTVVSTLATPWTITWQAPLPMRFSGQEYWSGLPFPPQVIFPTHRLSPCLLYLVSCSQADSLPLRHLREIISKGCDFGGGWSGL